MSNVVAADKKIFDGKRYVFAFHLFVGRRKAQRNGTPAAFYVSAADHVRVHKKTQFIEDVGVFLYEKSDGVFPRVAGKVEHVQADETDRFFDLFVGVA